MADVDDSTVSAFAELFKGRTDAWGSVEGKSNKEPVTIDHYRRHLEGKTSLGVYMLQDDGTCHFAALDLDEKDIDKALKIRQAFADLGIPAYLAYSKGKGFHCYLFADKKPFVARDIRRLMTAVLSKLNIECEMFPKQEKLDPTRPLGNYINLPCFGSTRMFFGASKTAYDVKRAVGLIKRSTNDDVIAARETIPDPPKPTLIKAKGRPKKSKNPVCIDGLLKGMPSGSRDVAAFALARYFLDQNFQEDEILSLLQQWDLNNQPPIGDPLLLRTKVQSAAKGYGFGCGSIKDDPLLAGVCNGETHCLWLKEQTEDRKKKGLVREESFHETETHLYEEVIRDGKVQFAAYEISTGNVQYVETIDYPSHSVVPVNGQELTENVIKFPTGIMEYGDTAALQEEIKQLIYDYVELPDEDINLWITSWYVLLTWVYDKLNTVSYIRFRGDTGVGKSRALTVIGDLCYKPLMMAGAVTPAPIYREIKRFRGTVILEEADFSDSSEKSEVVTLLNCGMERGRAVLRCSANDPNVIECLPVFGPKLFATRGGFSDKALEARCNTIVMREATRKVPTLLNSKYEKRALNIRNKLLLWRFKQRPVVDADVDEIDLGNVEQRLKQMALPLAIVFHKTPGFVEILRDQVLLRQQAIIEERSETDEASIVRTLLNIALDEGTQWLTSKSIAIGMSSENIEKEKLKSLTHSIAARLKSLGFKTGSLKLKPGLSKRARYLIWDHELVVALAIKYVPDPYEDYSDLLNEKIDLDI